MQSNAALLSEIIIGGCREELSMYRQHDIVLSLLEKLENEQMNKEEVKRRGRREREREREEREEGEGGAVKSEV